MLVIGRKIEKNVVKSLPVTKKVQVAWRMSGLRLVGGGRKMYTAQKI
ncbi:hypothetical protein ACQCT5_00975 [Sutcliffiella halmapala]